LDSLKIEYNQIELELSSYKSLWYNDYKALIISDLHAGKTQHFRKHGIPLPTGSLNQDLKKIDELISYYKAKNLYVTGDFFHSDYNSEFEEIKQWRASRGHVNMELIKGNHDIISNHNYKKIDIKVTDRRQDVGDLVLIHEHKDYDNMGDNKLVVSGHLHPRIILYTKSRQYIKMSCFLLRGNNMLMPAFGSFTGGYNIKPIKGDRIFGIGDGVIFPLNG